MRGTGSSGREAGSHPVPAFRRKLKRRSARSCVFRCARSPDPAPRARIRKRASAKPEIPFVVSRPPACCRCARPSDPAPRARTRKRASAKPEIPLVVSRPPDTKLLDARSDPGYPILVGGRETTNEPLRCSATSPTFKRVWCWVGRPRTTPKPRHSAVGAGSGTAHHTNTLPCPRPVLGLVTVRNRRQ
jgi:hypothetical protein